ncbi:MAG: AsnC family transcriptional regulator [Ignavibacteriae bacterium HGW-Ignavibacteriae-2]|jgi:Lrp/AsnC family leucine-responsive transcriptional regulator|nr:Lrp/AsnC family transcriptional regulator [Bacteroidota bacterium]PKL87886.1 MAG: AsnC family transcriptional regulator [Ignavibacteriae bacterium HGW-Ignavibacteriae-2]
MLDKIDIKILNMLQEQGRTKRNVLAEAVGLSLPSLSERLKKLEEHGIIEGYYAKLDKKIFGYDIMAFITVVMDSSKSFASLSGHVKKTTEILECYSVLGEGSHIMKAIVKDTEALEKLLTKIQSWPGVTRTVTSFVLSTIKETNKLNIN